MQASLFNIKNNLTIKLIIFLILLSFLFAGIISYVQARSGHQELVKTQKEEFNNIRKSYYQSIMQNAYDLDIKRLELIASGILNTGEIQYVSITEHNKNTNKTYLLLEKGTKGNLVDTFSISYSDIQADLDHDQYVNVKMQAQVPTLPQYFKKYISSYMANVSLIVFSQAIFIYLIMHLFVIRHIIHSANFSYNFKIDKPGDKLQLNRFSFFTSEDDAVGKLQHAINNMRKNMLNFKKERTKYEEKIENNNKKLRIAKEEAEKSQQLLENITDNMFDLVSLSDLDGNFKFINQSHAILGYKLDCLIGKNVLEFVHPDDLPKVKNSMKSIVKKQNEPRIEYRYRCADDSYVWLETIGRILDDEQILFSSREITKRKKAQEDKNRLQEQLQQTQKLESIGTLAGGIAHDFNNILTVIIGLSELLLSEIDRSDPNYSNLETIHESGLRAAKLTEQLLLFSRKKDPEYEVININETIHDLSKMLERLIGENINMTNQLEKNLWDINGDKNQLEQVITNLVVNARDAMPNGGDLTIRTKNEVIESDKAKTIPDIEPGEYILLSVEDTGHGISKDIQNKIFDPFFSTKEMTNGTGMGLSVVHGIIKNHNGLINVYSESGEGTIFKIYLPRIRDKEEGYETEVSIEDYQEYKGHGETILIAEDEEPVLTYLTSIFDNYGYNYYSTRSGEQARQTFDDTKDDIDLLLSDVIMTGMNGVELAKNLKQEKPDLKVILSSGYSNKKVSKTKIKNMGYGFIQKPYNIMNLLEVIHKTIHRG